MAQTAGIIEGTSMLVYVDGVAITGTTGHSMALAVNMRDATNKDSGGKEDVLPGVSSATISFDYLVKWDATYGYEDLFALYTAKTKVVLKFSSEIVGNPKFSGDAYLESLDMDTPMNDNITSSGSFHITGGLTKATIT